MGGGPFLINPHILLSLPYRRPTSGEACALPNHLLAHVLARKVTIGRSIGYPPIWHIDAAKAIGPILTPPVCILLVGYPSCAVSNVVDRVDAYTVGRI